jgi:hypothetical protein
VRLHINARTIDRVMLLALIALVVTYSLFVGDTIAISAGWAWLGVAIILFAANAARLNIGARPSEHGVAVGAATLILAVLRITGAVQEVTLIVAAATVAGSLLLLRILRRTTK